MFSFTSWSIFMRLIINILRAHFSSGAVSVVVFSLCCEWYFPASLNAWQLWLDVQHWEFYTWVQVFFVFYSVGWVFFWDSVMLSESAWFSEVCFKLCDGGSRAIFTLRIITPITELWPFWTLSLMSMVLGLPIWGIFHIPSPFGSSQKCSAYCFWVVLVPSLMESLPYIYTDRTQPKTHRGPFGDLQSASSVESPLRRTPSCKFLALWFPWHTTIFLFDWAWFG